MRLAQAARKLSITTEDIVSFLAKKDIEIVKDSNTKLDESSIKLLFDYYGYPEEKAKEKEIPIEVKESRIVEAEEKLEEKIQDTDFGPEGDEEKPDINLEEETNENITFNTEEIDNTSLEYSGNVKEEELNLIEDLKTTPTDSEAQKKTLVKKYKTVNDLLDSEGEKKIEEANDDDDDDEVIIKAAKVNLKGLNVLGKIELPEPRPKVEKSIEEKPKTRKSSKRTDEKDFRKNRNKRKELSPQEAREREKRRAEKKKKLEEAEKRKKREAYYKENVLKPKQELQKKKQSKKKAATKDLKSNHQIKKDEPKTVLGKFWRWLNT